MSKKLLKNLPSTPGCYLFKNKTGRVIYVGKAKKLNSRVRSYFTKSATLSPAKQQMISEIAGLDTIIVNNETEALLLEITLIKKYRPRYNVVMKDDKNFVYLKIPNSTFPQPQLVRKIEDDEAKYFGPYLSARRLRTTMRYLNKIFPFCTCKRNLNRIKPSDVCFQYHLGRCLGPSSGKCTAAAYQKMIEQLTAFLSGQTKPITDDLQTKMRQAAKEKKFELAARYRNRLQDIAKLNSPQQIIGKKNVSYDIISFWQAKNKKAVNIFKIRTGRLTDKITIALVTKETDPGEILEQFISQYYGQSPDIPPEILTSHPVQIKTSGLSYLTKKNVKIKTPQKGRLKKLVNLGLINAASYLEQKAPTAGRQKNIIYLKKLQSALSLPTLPKRIEAYDIANIQGQYAVGSMVVLTNGQLDKKEYRRFRIKYASGINDTAMLAEVFHRRFANHPAWPMPDLILLDGGKGQASTVAKTLANLKINIPLAALAKKDEIIYLLRKNNCKPKSKNSPKWKYDIYKLTKNLPPLSLLQNLRDEAHRTANSFYQQQHRQGQIASKLDKIPGIGPKTKIKLQQRYDSLADLKNSNYAKLSKIIGKKKAALIKKYLK